MYLSRHKVLLRDVDLLLQHFGTEKEPVPADEGIRFWRLRSAGEAVPFRDRAAGKQGGEETAGYPGDPPGGFGPVKSVKSKAGKDKREKGEVEVILRGKYVRGEADIEVTDTVGLLFVEEQGDAQLLGLFADYSVGPCGTNGSEGEVRRFQVGDEGLQFRGIRGLLDPLEFPLINGRSLVQPRSQNLKRKQSMRFWVGVFSLVMLSWCVMRGQRVAQACRRCFTQLRT